jgi:hypothetical protein
VDLQLTLVSHYGPKPPQLAALIAEVQAQLAFSLGRAFTPYALEQMHGTIVGLEGSRTVTGILNENFRRLRNVEHCMDFEVLLRAVRSVEPFPLRVGGFAAGVDYGFTSNGSHPFVRSFSIQRDIAVGMGWPWTRGACSPSLASFRKSLECAGVLHKWHRREEDRDNDFFFVLGRVDRISTTDEEIKHVEDQVRQQLGERTPIELEVNSEALMLVAYEDARLPLSTSRAWQATDPSLNAAMLHRIY